MNYINLRLDREWHKENPPLKEGTILEYLGGDYRYDEKHWLSTFKIIGEPVAKAPSIKVEYR